MKTIRNPRRQQATSDNFRILITFSLANCPLQNRIILDTFYTFQTPVWAIRSVFTIRSLSKFLIFEWFLCCVTHGYSFLCKPPNRAPLQTPHITHITEQTYRANQSTMYKRMDTLNLGSNIQTLKYPHITFLRC